MLYLDEGELIEKTGFKHRGKQYAELARQGVPFTRRGDGKPLVLRSDIEKPVTVTKRKEPNFKALLKRTG
jgi:hypothetical protein